MKGACEVRQLREGVRKDWLEKVDDVRKEVEDKWCNEEGMNVIQKM